MPDSPPKRPRAPSPGPGEETSPRISSQAGDPRCELLREIGAGAYGTVHLARLGAAFVAVKRCDRPADPAAAAAFLRELRGVRDYVRLPPHEGLVRVLRLVEDPGGAWFWYAMELADREDGSSADGLSAAGADAYRPRTLASVLDAEVALPLRECVDLGLRLAGALAFLQSRHLAHRDVKPSNVLFVRGRPVLADIGLVRDVPALSRAARLTASAGDPEPLRSGVDRPIGGETNAFDLPLGGEVAYSFDAPTEVAEARFVFDSDLARLREAKYNIRSNYAIQYEPQRVPDTLVRDFRVETQGADGAWTLLSRVTDNHRRLVRVTVGRAVTAVRVVPERLWGGGTLCRLFASDVR